jgi:arylsulfatase A-like enzyme
MKIAITTATAIIAAITVIIITAACTKSRDSGTESREHGRDAADGSLRLDTSSLESGRVYSGNDNIPRGKNYNIILYFLESFPAKYLDLEVDGKAVVPNWHRLARNAFVARNHYANFPLTANALLSVFTSAYDPVFKTPFEPGAAVQNSESLKLIVKNHPDIPLKTMPEILKERGYRNFYFHTWTLGYVGTRRFLKKRKFDELFEMYQLRQASGNNGKMGYGIDDRSMIEPSIRVLKKESAKPFFAVYCPLSPHFPYPIPDEKYNITGPRLKNATFEEDCKRKYISLLHYSDTVLGMLIDRLEAEGLLDNTLVFIFADHGQAFLEHKGNFRHRTGIYEENVHVPFMLYSRRFFSSPVLFDGITSHIDILPTVQDILGLPALPEQEGLSMLSSRREQMALFQTYGPNHMMGVRDGRWKYLYDFKRRASELYDLSVDAEEKNNLAGEMPGVAARYHAIVEQSYRHRVEYYRKVMKTDREL